MLVRLERSRDAGHGEAEGIGAIEIAAGDADFDDQAPAFPPEGKTVSSRATGNSARAKTVTK